MIYVWLVLFIFAVVVFWAINFAGLPGNWLIVLTAALWFWLGPDAFQFSWLWLILLSLLALAGEGIEFVASVFGAKKLGGSNRGATLSVIGSMVGALIGALVGIPIPIPIVGILIGSMLFAALGAWAGAIIGEKWYGKTMEESVKIGGAAFVGRLLGTIGKLLIGTIMVALTIAATLI